MLSGANSSCPSAFCAASRARAFFGGELAFRGDHRNLSAADPDHGRLVAGRDGDAVDPDTQPDSLRDAAGSPLAATVSPPSGRVARTHREGDPSHPLGPAPSVAGGDV